MEYFNLNKLFFEMFDKLGLDLINLTGTFCVNFKFLRI